MCERGSTGTKPSLNTGNTSGLRICEQYFSASRGDIRACILVKGVRYDVCSAYFPSDAKEASPLQKFKDLIGDCEAEGVDLVIGCDANSHHTVWGSNDRNIKGETLLKFLKTFKTQYEKRFSTPRWLREV